LLSAIAILGIFIVMYERITFARINNNKWYLLYQAGIDTRKMLVRITFNTVISIFLVYSSGYITTLLLALFFKYKIIYGYLLSLYISGLLDMLFIVWSVMLISVFVKSVSRARMTIGIVIITWLILRNATGYSTLVKSRLKMTDTANLFRWSVTSYIYIMITLIIISLVVTLVFAVKKRMFYYDSKRENIPWIKEFKTDKFLEPKKYKENRVIRITIKAVKYIMYVLILFIMVANIFILIISLGSSSAEFDINGYIPYIVQSTTMEDEIMENDLVLFKKVDEIIPIDKGTIVIFKANDKVYIEEITNVDEDVYTMDIINYPDYIDKGSVQQEVSRDAIYGELSSTHRILGALILFANSFMGRMLLFLLPVLIIFFMDNITEFIEKRLKANN